ncbi:AraC family transcriptional regulator ligand-binding domain-containing protein [Zavarzinia sp.]|uniref:AraC family transcriptional regulator n=1 Tax=Zavarzinia sp. TaxID=2027920 RepID=UPI00356517CA
MTDSKRRIPIRYFLLLRDFLRGAGVDTAAVLAAACIRPATFERADGGLTLEQVEAFLGAVTAISGRPHPGIDMGSLIKATSHDLLGLGMMSSRNLDAALRLVARHYHLMNELFLFRYRRTAGQGEAVYTPAVAMAPATLRFFLDLLAVAHHRQLCLILGPDLLPYEIHLSAPQPDDSRPYDAFLPARFHFDPQAVPGVRVVMGASLLSTPLPMADARVVAEIDARCTALARARPIGENGWTDFVAMLLRESAGRPASLAEIAARCRQSPRTIERRLAREGTSYRRLVQQSLIARARDLLGEPGTRIAQVAAQLGFSDSANFSRAFKRETGHWPSGYRQLEHEAGPPATSLE